MSKNGKRLVLASMVVAVLVALASIADMIMKVPFAGKIMMDVMFLVGASLVIYMGYEAYREAA